MTDKASRLDELGREVGRAVKGAVDWLRNGSVEEVLVGMVGERMLDRETLQRLAGRIEEAKNEKSREDKEGQASCWRSSFEPR